jgi:NTP pyrophosphatase (non-canonical NTP hydrolase)
MYVDMDNYQRQAESFTNNDLDLGEVVLMCTLGISSEAGEIAEEIKHHVYHGHELDTKNLQKELGDMLWYVSRLAHAYGWNLSEIAEMNIQKLTARYPTGFTSDASINRVENQ